MEEDELENHCSWHHLNQQAHLVVMGEDELENHCSWLCLNELACLAAMEDNELENGIIFTRYHLLGTLNNLKQMYH
jgi:hypothetical protein